MNFTVADIITVLVNLTILIAAIRAGRKLQPEIRKTTAETKLAAAEANLADAEAKNTEADTAAKWQALAERSVEANQKLQGQLQEQVDKLTERADAKDLEIQELRQALTQRDGKITELQSQVAERDKRIEELERLSGEQSTELEQLRSEVEELRRKRGK